MSSRFLLLPPIAVGLIAGHRTAPLTTKYKIELKAETTVDLTPFGQGEQKNSQGMVAYVGVTLSDTSGGKVMHVVVDSVRVESGAMQISPGTVDSAKGATIHGFVDPHWKISRLKSSLDSNLVVAQIRGLMGSFYPRVKAGAKQGEAWTDTTDVENKGPQQAIKSRIVTNYTAGAQETVSGTAAMKVEAAFSATLAGTLENPMAGQMEMEGSETGTGSHYIAADGRYLGGSSTSSGKSLVKSAMAPDPISVKSVRSIMVTVIR